MNKKTYTKFQLALRKKIKSEINTYEIMIDSCYYGNQSTRPKDCDEQERVIINYTSYWFKRYGKIFDERE